MILVTYKHGDAFIPVLLGCEEVALELVDYLDLIGANGCEKFAGGVVIPVLDDSEIGRIKLARTADDQRAIDELMTDFFAFKGERH
jgi:hypothetical protein